MKRKIYYRYNSKTLVYDRIYPSTYSRIKNILLNFMQGMIIGVISMSLFFIFFVAKNENGINKSRIDNVIVKTIQNGGDLNDIRFIYTNVDSYLTYQDLIPFRTKNDSIYERNISLSQILNSIKIDHYIKGEVDTVFMSKLTLFIKENEEINPFDKLPANQSYFFKNIQSKLNQDFYTISEDMNRISEELNHNNNLIDKYLTHSNLSLYISIIALVLTLFFSIYNIFQQYSSSKVSKEMFNSFKEQTEKED